MNSKKKQLNQKLANKFLNGNQGQLGCSLLPVAIAFVIAACITSRTHRNVPTWIDKLPYEKGKLYAVGICGPTYFRDDGLVRAADNARKELAKSLGGRIQSVVLTKQSARAGQLDEAFLFSATSWSMDIVMTCSQIVTSWVDDQGEFSGGQRGYTYALAVLDFASIPIAFEQLAKQRRMTTGQIDSLRRRAEEEFQKDSQER